MLAKTCRGLTRAVHRKLTSRSYISATLVEVGKPIELKHDTEPAPLNESEVRVKVHSAGVNAFDVSMISGQHFQQLTLPAVPGFEFSGEVLEVGSGVQSFRAGDRVLGLKTQSTGAFAEQCVAEETELYAIPHSLSYEIAASIPVAYGTSLLALNLIEIAKMKQGQTALVLTAQGGTGMALVDLATNVFQCQVIAGTDTEAKCAVIRPKGVLATVEYTDENLVKLVGKHTKNAGADVVFDTVGGNCFLDGMKCLKPNGKLVSLGYSSGQAPSVSVQDLIRHQAQVMGVWLGGFARQRPSAFQSLIKQIIGMLDEQYFEPHIGARFTLQQVNDALKYVSNLEALGKVILNVPQK